VASRKVSDLERKDIRRNRSQAVNLNSLIFGEVKSLDIVHDGRIVVSLGSTIQ